MDRNRSDRQGDRRSGREDTRNHKQRYDQDRSRSPPRRDRQNDRRRDRSPPRGPAARSGPPPPRSDRERDFQRREAGPPRGRPDTKPSREPGIGRSNGVVSKTTQGGKVQQPDVKMEDVPEDEDEDAEMKRIMGFADFRSTKNTKVPGNDKNHGIHKVKKAEYRQYMNRVGGFNRPLEAM